MSGAVRRVQVAAVFQPGHFTAGIRRHDWPPGFEPKYQRTREVELSEQSRLTRERWVANGDTGTIVGSLSRRSVAVRNDPGKCRIERAIGGRDGGADAIG